MKDIRRNQDLIWKNMHYKESILKQNSRYRWIKEGDNNTKCFHFVVNFRARRNSIVLIKTPNGLVKDVCGVNEAIKNHFEARFHKCFMPRPRLQNINFKSLSIVDRDRVEEVFSEEEIKRVVFEGDGDKSPGPDGFNLVF
ncbi:unnamed protein product [Vicia faba]|uniref:Uncharacterized protein n=1 Tax=Vicia faba TaxID=3906 RepID=A0AAV0ZRR5_VICFA|nr:unnamed protein product [Vicia faba]